MTCITLAVCREKLVTATYTCISGFTAAKKLQREGEMTYKVTVCVVRITM